VPEDVDRLSRRRNRLLKKVSVQEIRKLRSWYQPEDIVWAKLKYPILNTLERPALLLDVGNPKKNLDPLCSKIGGAIGWPADELPVSSSSGPYTPIVQLRKLDFPLIAFPTGTDLLQILWRPQDLKDEITEHKKWIGKWALNEACTSVMSADRAPAVLWRKSKELTGILEPPRVAAKYKGLFPEGSCALSGRLVNEFPVRLEQFGLDIYQRQMQSCENFRQAKVGGHPSWTAAGGMEPKCKDCGVALALIVSLDPLVHNGKGGWHNPSKLFHQFGGNWMLFACEKCDSRPVTAVSRLY
jgi:hypothetical protein